MSALFQGNAASQELSALYSDNLAYVEQGLDASPQGIRVGC